MTLDFPATGSTHHVPFFRPPRRDKETDEEWAAVEAAHAPMSRPRAEVRLLSPARKRKVTQAYHKLLAAERARVADLPADAVERTLWTDEGWAEHQAWGRSTCEEALVSVSELSVNGEDLGELRGQALIERLEAADLLVTAGLACMLGQAPDPKQVER